MRGKVGESGKEWEENTRLLSWSGTNNRRMQEAHMKGEHMQRSQQQRHSISIQADTLLFQLRNGAKIAFVIIGYRWNIVHLFTQDM